MSQMGQLEKTFHRDSTAGLPSTADLVTDGRHRRSVPEPGPDVATHSRPCTGGERPELARIRADIPPDRDAHYREHRGRDGHQLAAKNVPR